MFWSMNFAFSLVSLALLLAKSTLVVCIAFVASWMLRKHSGAARHGLWLAVMALLIAIIALAPYSPWHVRIAPPSLDNFVPAAVSQKVARKPSSSTQATAPKSAYVPAPHPSSVQRAYRAALAVNWTRQLLFVWWIGIAFVLMRQIVARVQLSRLSRRAREADAEATSRFAQIARADGIRRPVALLVSDDLDVPLTWGMFNARVLLPRSYTEWERSRLENVLQHELAHVRRLDAFTALLADVACALYWYNPLVWMASTQMRLEREIACDEAVLASGARASDYATDLLDLAVNVRFGSLHRAGLAIAGCPRFEQRVKKILKGTPRTALSRVALVATVLGAVAVLPLAAFQVSDQAPRKTYPIPSPEVMTFLNYATSGRIDQVVKMATDDPSLINARAREGQTALYEALVSLSPRGHDVALWLIAHGADVNAQTSGLMGSTVLMSAMKYPDILQILLDRGADPNVADILDRNALDMAVMSKSGPFNPDRRETLDKSIKLLRDHGAKLSFTAAVLLPDVDVAKEYLTNDPSLVHRFWPRLIGSSALIQAVTARQASGEHDRYQPMVDLLTSFLPDPTPCEAAMLGRTDLVAKAADADPSLLNKPAEKQPALLSCALIAGEKGTVLFLLNHGAKLRGTELRESSLYSDADTIRLLLSFGAAKGMNKGSLETLAIWADQRGKKDVGDLLRTAE